MNTNLILEYLFIQILIFIIAFYMFKRMKSLLRKEDNNNTNNGYGIGSTFGVLLGLILFSAGAFYANIIKQISFGEFLINVISEMFK